MIVQFFDKVAYIATQKLYLSGIAKQIYNEFSIRKDFLSGLTRTYVLIRIELLRSSFSNSLKSIVSSILWNFLETDIIAKLTLEISLRRKNH